MPDGAGARRLAWMSLLLVAGTILATVGGPVIGRGVLHASDTLQLEAPWKADAPHGFTPHNTSTSDTVDATVPVRIEWSRRVRAGDLPLWSDLHAAGAPLAALPNVSAFSPMSLLWYVVPPWYAPAATKLLEMAVASLFTFLLARRLGAGTVASAIAAVAFAGSGFQTVWTNWPHAQVAALVPALLWAVDRAIDRGRPVDVVPIALVAASMWFGGFPAVTLWAYLVVGLYALLRARRELHRLGVAFVGVMLGAMLAAVQLLPFAYRLGELDLAYRQAKVGALPWRMLATMVVPDAFGNPAEKVFYGFRNYTEINTFAGATVVVLAVTGLALGGASRVPRMLRWFLAGAIAVCIALIFVGGPPLATFQRIPIVGPNGIGRLRSVLALFVALQAGVGVDALTRGVEDRRRVVVLGAGLAVVGLGTALLLGSVAGTAEAVGQRDYFTDQLVLPAVVGAVAVVLVLVATVVRAATARTAVVAVLGLLVAVESVTFARAFLPRIDRDLFYPETPTHEYLAGALGTDRFIADGFTMVPGSTIVYGLRSATAHSLTPAPYADLLEAIDPTVFDRSRTYPILSRSPALVTSPALDRIGVTHVVTDPDTPVAGAPDLIAPATGQEEVPAGGALAAEVPPGGIRAVRLELRPPVAPVTETSLMVELRDADADLLATGRRRVLERTPAGATDVALDRSPDPSSPGPWTVTVRVEADAGSLVLGTADPGTPAITLVRPVDDAVHVAFTDGATVYVRQEEPGRFRWASRAVVEPDPKRRVRLVTDGDLPIDTVVLSEDPRGDVDAGEGRPAVIDVTDAGGDTLRVDMDAEAAGYLVVADTIQDGWAATVDDQPTELLDADHAFVAVPVPAGKHAVELRYAPRGLAVGLVASGLAVVTLLGLILNWQLRTRSNLSEPQ